MMSLIGSPAFLDLIKLYHCTKPFVEVILGIPTSTRSAAEAQPGACYDTSRFFRNNCPLVVTMSALRLSRAALRARSAVALKPIQRRGYADAVSDKIKLSLALPHQVCQSQDIVLAVHRGEEQY